MSAKYNSSRETAPRFRQIIICILAAALSLAAALPALAAPPALPSSFWGTITLNGSNAPDGTVISAWINGVNCAATTTFTYTGQSVYSIDVPGDDPDTPGVQGGTEGDTIIFKVEGYTTDQTATWHEGTNTELNLSVTPVPLPANDAYGNLPGNSQYANEVTFSFGGQSGDVSITYEAWHNNAGGEIRVYINGNFVDWVPTAGDYNNWHSYSIVLPDGYVNDAETNYLRFDNIYNPPYSAYWGVRQVRIGAAAIPLPANDAYGNLPGNSQYANEVTFSFGGQSGDVSITYEAWHNNAGGEIRVYINGNFVDWVPTAGDYNNWHSYSIVLPDGYVNDAETNYLRFDNIYNPPYSASWGVRQVRIGAAAIPLPANDAYGNLPGNSEYANEVTFSFSGQSGDVSISYEAWHNNAGGEIRVYINGNFVDWVPTAGDYNNWHSYSIVLPDGYVNDAETNYLRFDNIYNPPYSASWGVRQVRIGAAAVPLPANDAYGNLPVNSEYANEVTFSFGGQSGDVSISYEAWHNNVSGEVGIYINGKFVGSWPTAGTTITGMTIRSCCRTQM